MTMTELQKTESTAERASATGPAAGGTEKAPETGFAAAGPDGANAPEGQTHGRAAGAGGIGVLVQRVVEELSAQREAIGKVDGKVTGLAGALDGTGAGQGDSLDGKLEKLAQRIEEQVRVYTADFHRWQEVNRRFPAKIRAAFTAVSFAAVFSLGVLVEQRWQPVPVQDGTGGWKDHLWQHFGQKFIDCHQGIGEKTADGSCAVIVARKR